MDSGANVLPRALPSIHEQEIGMRSTHLTVNYPGPFTLSGYPHELPAGPYELLLQEETIGGRGKVAFQWTAAYLTLPGKSRKVGRSKRRPLNSVDLATAMRHRRAPSARIGEAALYPKENLE
ncbi:hypothetical protein N8I71_09160 [Roseibacterium sp. SDUM158016]|jgi:hypothetical protein|uniref:hypothetical protein n=1 Tax=Roseicyclus sediminis TaxID=2980997 RepID=UPI0021D15F77|nr:hypothetical protein [Roseibacterium sp. SDUM158016]MCU4652999.1 hypothetical protein [Roseibacterium sp. SDUM158016]